MKVGDRGIWRHGPVDGCDVEEHEVIVESDQMEHGTYRCRSVSGEVIYLSPSEFELTRAAIRINSGDRIPMLQNGDILVITTSTTEIT